MASPWTRTKLCAIGLCVLALVPAARLAWSWRAMSHLDFYHDDAIYCATAKSLATGAGYRIASLPTEPYQTKYPPLYPALLSLVWRIDPAFPSNLPLATLFAWLMFPFYVWATWAALRLYGFDWREQCVLVIAAALNPMAAVLGFSLMPELLFTSLLLASLVIAERALESGAPAWLPAIAGLIAGAAYLTKSAALPLLATVPLCFVLRKRYRGAAWFLATMFPAVAVWQWWVARHVSHAWDLVTLYYTNYIGFQIYNVPLRDLPLVVWSNLDAFLQGAGKLLTFDVEFGSKHLERIVAVAAIAGAVRLASRTRKLQLPLAAAGMSIVLLIWHYQPDQRFVFPLYPILLAGLWTELKNVFSVMRLAWAKPTVADRVAAALGAAALAGFALFVAFTNLHADFVFFPRLFAEYRADLDRRLPAYRWIASNVPTGANVFAYDDPLLYLYTGRKSCNLPIPPKFYYHHDDAGIDRLLSLIPEFSRDQRLDYVMLTPGDFYRDLRENGAKHLARYVEESPAFGKLYADGYVTIYRLLPADKALAKSTAVVLPPHTSTPTRSPASGL